MSENERNCSSSRSQTEISSSSRSLESFQDDNEKNSDENLTRCKEERSKMDSNNSDLVLNFRAKRIIYPGTSEEDEEEASEKLSAVVEQRESPSHNIESSNSLETRDGNELNNILQDRVKFLQKTMIQLREQLKTEVALWKKEKEEFQLLRERRDILALEEATAAACAAAAAYAAESPLSNELGDVDISSEQAFRELAILEYEKELAKYQDAYSFAQADARYNARRQLIAKVYEQKIIEVERLCNEELEKIQQNANNLQPLKEMVLQWHTAYDRGDLQKNEDSETKNQRYKLASKRFENELQECHKVDAEVNMMPELFVGKYTPSEPVKRPSI